MFVHTAEIAFNKKVSQGTFLMGLRSPEIAARARPGQFVMVRVSPGLDPLLRRPFSICGTRGKDLFLILYRVVGRGTGILRDRKEGERVSVLGPLGKRFDLTRAKSTALLVAGGIGIAPLIFLAQALDPEHASFLTGYSSIGERVPLEEMGMSPIEVSLATDDGSAGHRGFVTDLLENRLGNLNGSPSGIFACGPLAMLKRVAAMALDRGVPCQVSMEAHMACGLGACQGCAVPASSEEGRAYFHVCQDGPVFHAETLDWERL